ncbi:glucosidase 2 subunit beta-like isoform X1 [Dermacentor andersoni]|uniref:glucosidase 2 subunit beta-like isoform X1 n=1 Tax=Dermacentor andersoni TaxID=34620 RepID=UPI00215525F6|nr:glucosidase 2 subunit beta-like isoform X1 [Dermacentor andersoni]
MAATTRGKAGAMPCTTREMVSYVIFALLLVSARCLADDTIRVSRPRGVALKHASLYDRARNFTCFDGKRDVEFFMVNDDYCDCEDGSDEPGTSACINGKFHCNNLGHKGKDIPSSWVNDGICDCCDGSDEYSTSAGCVNNCLELGRQAREEEAKMRELLSRGLQLQQEMANEGKQHRLNCKNKLEELRGSVEEARKSRDALEAVKTQAMEAETQALQKYKDADAERKREQEELEMQRHQEEEKAHAREAFGELDLDGNGMLTVEELQKNNIFDQNRDGTVSVEEAKFFLHMKDEMGLEEFSSTGWMIMKPIYSTSKMPPAPETAPPPLPPPVEEQLATATTPMPPYKEEEEDDDEELPDDNGDEGEDEDDEVEPPKFPPKEDEDVSTDTSTADTTEYDEETKALMEAAKKARDEFTEADTKVRNLESEIRKLEQSLDTDYGPDDAYAALREQCFEFTDREYTYKLCPFDQASQAPKAGGGETSLGRWGSWNGPDDSKYSQMKYDGGATCWNGPARSVVVDLHCGLENQLTSASEPNRCEYHFDFSSPAACTPVPTDTPTESHVHEEL